MPSSGTPLFTISAGAPASDLDPGTYEMMLLSIVPKTILVQGEDRDIFEWTFGLVDDDTVEVRGTSSQNTSPKSKLVKWLGALLGPEAARVGAQYSAEDLIGRRGLVTVEINEQGWPKIADVGPLPTRRAVRRAEPGAATPQVPAATTTPLRAPTARQRAGGTPQPVEAEEAEELPF